MMKSKIIAYIISELKWIFSAQGVAIFSIFLAIVIVCQFIDQYAISIIQPLHSISTAIACLFLNFIGSIVFISVFGLFYYLIGNFSFIVTPEQFIILLFVGYLLAFYNFYKYFDIYKRKINIIFYLIFSIFIQSLFIFLVLIANTFYINNPNNNNFWKAIYISLGFYNNWLTQIIAGILITLLIPIVHHILYIKFNQRFKNKFIY